MKRSFVITVLQSSAVVLGCGLIGLSLTRLPGGIPAAPFIMALGGATIGLVGVAVRLVFLEPVRELEQRTGPRHLLGLRIGTVGGIVAAVGWLLAVFVDGTFGYWVVAPGILTGLVGLIIHRLNHARVHFQ